MLFFFFFLAQFLGETGRLQESSAIYTDIVQKDPNNFETIFNAANVLRQIPRNQEAERLFKRATELKPTVCHSEKGS